MTIIDSDTTGGLVGDMDIMFLIDKALESAAHGYHIVIGVRGENKDILRIGFSALRTSRIVRIGFASGPTGDGMLDIIKDFDITVICRPVKSNQFGERVVGIVLIGKFKDGFIRSLA